MSIPNIFHKIKSESGIDRNTFLFLFIIVGVGIGAFGLGRLSVVNNINDIKNDNIIIEDIDKISDNKYYDNNDVFTSSLIEKKEKMYVASKNGKLYYSLGCGGAKRIKIENEIWFSTIEDAEKSGYIRASSC
jgi:hypothetical protein